MKLGAVILAAGAGTRMGGVAKALLRRGQHSFLENIVQTANADEVVVVVGPPFGDAVAAHARELGARVVVNDEPSRGMASSVSIGFANVGMHDAAWLWPVDHPDVRRSTLDALLAALANHDVAQPRYQGRGGHPPLIARALFDQLAHCTNLEHGARSVIANANVVAVNVDDPGCVEDVDT